MTAKQTNKRAANRRVSQKKSPENGGQVSTEIMRCPVYRPIYKFHRTIEEAYDITCDGINPSLGAMSFNLSSVPNSTNFTNLFDMYRITKVKIDWIPEYTELTDAALVSNAVNVRFNTAIDISDTGVPADVDTVLTYQQLHSTGITKPHSRTWVPAFLMGSLVPCTCWLPTSASTQPHLGLKYGIPPTGTAMILRSRVKLWIECANVN